MRGAAGGAPAPHPRPRWRERGRYAAAAPRRDYCGRVKLSSGLPAGVVFIATASDTSR